ncbi:hypothetical protein ACTFIY_007795 [Dictyostelium cf. discoideum]
MSIFNVIIKYFITKLEKFNIGCKIQILTYGDSVQTILKFGSEQEKMKESLKDIKFSKTNNEAKLGETMELCFQVILESSWEPSDFNSKIFSSGKSTDDSIDGFLDNLSLDNVEIYGLACNCSLITNPNVVINNLPDQKIIQLEKNFNQDIKLLINGGSGSDSVLPSGSIIKFLSNKYYSSYTIQLKRDLDIGESFEETIKLEFKKDQLKKYQFENFPSKISFTIQVAGNEKVFEALVYLNISYFLGDLKSNEMCTNKCIINVEGDVGSSKSSLLNDFSKDIQYLRLLTRDFQLCKLKNQIDLINKSNDFSNLSINNNNNNYNNNSLIIKSQLSSPTFSSKSQQIDSNTLSSSMSDEVINVIIDLVSEKGDDVLFTYEFECFQNDSIVEIKSKLLNEINPQIDINEWNVTNKTGTILLGSSKLSTVIKYSKKEIDNIKLILKKKNQ